MESLTLQERLINEAKQSPAKAIVLVGGLALAIYMWAPLLLNGTGASNVTPTPPSGVGTSANQTSGTSSKTDEEVWFKRYQEFQQTKLLEPWEASSIASQANSPVPLAVAPPSVLSSEDISKLAVSGVLIGGRTGHLANLNNRVIREGEHVWINFSDPQPEPSFNQPAPSNVDRWCQVTLSRVYSDRVELTVGGEVTTVPVRINRDK